MHVRVLEDVKCHHKIQFQMASITHTHRWTYQRYGLISHIHGNHGKHQTH